MHFQASNERHFYEDDPPLKMSVKREGLANFHPQPARKSLRLGGRSDLDPLAEKSFEGFGGYVNESYMPVFAAVRPIAGWPREWKRSIKDLCTSSVFGNSQHHI